MAVLFSIYCSGYISWFPGLAHFSHSFKYDLIIPLSIIHPMLDSVPSSGVKSISTM
jgi:hypothetical protein